MDEKKRRKMGWDKLGMRNLAFSRGNSNINSQKKDSDHQKGIRSIYAIKKNLNIHRSLFGGNSNKGSSDNDERQNSVENKQIKSLIIDIHSLLLGSDIKKYPGNYSQKYNPVEEKQSIRHNLPFFANNNDIQLLKTNPVTPNVITGQLILSTENAGINTDASTTIDKLPNKVESALNSDWEKFTNSVCSRTDRFVNSNITM